MEIFWQNPRLVLEDIGARLWNGRRGFGPALPHAALAGPWQGRQGLGLRARPATAHLPQPFRKRARTGIILETELSWKEQTES